MTIKNFNRSRGPFFPYKYYGYFCDEHCHLSINITIIAYCFWSSKKVDFSKCWQLESLREIIGKHENDEIAHFMKNVHFWTKNGQKNSGNMNNHGLRHPCTLFCWNIFKIQEKKFFDFLGLGGGSEVGRGWSFGGVNDGNWKIATVAPNILA